MFLLFLLLQVIAIKLGKEFESSEYWMVSKTAIAIRVKSDKINPKVLYAYVSSNIAQTQLLAITKGATIANIYLKELRGLPIILPSIEEQQAVALVDESRKVQKEIQKLKSGLLAKKNELWSL